MGNELSMGILAACNGGDEEAAIGSDPNQEIFFLFCFFFPALFLSKKNCFAGCGGLGIDGRNQR